VFEGGLMLFFACGFGFCCGVDSRGRDVRPAAHSLSFASPKESKQRKGAPQSATPSLALRGRPAAGRLRGAAAELTARCALRSDSRGESEHEACVSFGTHAHPASTPPQAQPAGGKQPHTGHCFARPTSRALRAALGFPRARAERSDGPAVPTPFCACREAQGGGCVRVPKDTRTSCSDLPQHV